MLGSVKKFIKQYPFFWILQRKRYDMICGRHSRMSYAEIEAAIGREYEAIFGRKLNWDNPQTYNEKINVSKVYMPTPLKTRLADKYLVREWIREKIGEEYLIPLLGVYDSFDEIDFDSLPDNFVMKCSHDSASVTLVHDKKKLDVKTLKRMYDFYLGRNYAWLNWEMQYRDIRPRIIIEQYMGDEINDYKFMCFNGESYCCWVDFDRFTNHTRNFYNLEWERLNMALNLNYPNNPKDAACPENFDEMKRIARTLCENMPHVRVDLYCVGRYIYFGELTFTSGNGFEKFTPDEWDYKLGELWPFDNTVRRKILSEHSRP